MLRLFIFFSVSGFIHVASYKFAHFTNNNQKVKRTTYRTNQNPHLQLQHSHTLIFSTSSTEDNGSDSYQYTSFISSPTAAAPQVPNNTTKVTQTHVVPLSEHPHIIPEPVISIADSTVSEEIALTEPPKRSKWQRITTFFKNMRSKKYVTKDAVKKFGYNFLLSYAFVSNVSYVTCTIISYLTHAKATGKSPLEPGQWKPFLAIYAGLWAVNNFLRPARFALAITILPIFDKLIDKIQNKVKCKRSIATGIAIFCVNVVGTLSFLTVGLLVASKISGVPVFKKEIYKAVEFVHVV